MKNTHASAAVVFNSGLGLLAMAGFGSAQSEFFDLRGDQESGFLGTELKTGDDWNGDGVLDLVAGSHGYDAEWNAGGRVYAICGRTGDTMWTVDGDRNGQLLGEGIAVLEDIDGDGVGDVAVGGSGKAPTFGKVHLLSGASGSVLWTIVTPTGSTADGFGAVMSNAGDWDGDGLDDIAVGASVPDEIYIHSSSDGSVIHAISVTPFEVSMGEPTGESVALAGDWDGDGEGDLAFGVRASGDGRVWVYSSATRERIANFGVAEGTPETQYFGRALANVGDVNGDGLEDLLVGSGGAIEVRLGPDGAPWQFIEGPNNFGQFVAAAGDVNGDGAGDYATSAFLHGMVLSGVDGSLLYQLEFESGAASAGGNLDTNADGLAEVAWGSPQSSCPGMTGCGSVRLTSGSTGQIVPFGEGVLHQTAVGLPTAGGLPIELTISSPVSGDVGLVLIGFTATDLLLPGVGTLYTFPWVATVPWLADVPLELSLSGLNPSMSFPLVTQAWSVENGYTFSRALLWSVEAVPAP